MTSHSITGNETATTARPGRALNITLWTLQIALAAFFVFAGTPKVLGDPVAAEMFAKLGIGDWLQYFTGAVEVAGGIGLLIPRLSSLAAGGLSITMVLASVANLTALGMLEAAPMTLVLAAIFGAIAWGRRAQTVRLLHQLKGKKS